LYIILNYNFNLFELKEIFNIKTPCNRKKYDSFEDVAILKSKPAHALKRLSENYIAIFFYL